MQRRSPILLAILLLTVAGVSWKAGSKLHLHDLFPFLPGPPEPLAPAPLSYKPLAPRDYQISTDNIEMADSSRRRLVDRFHTLLALPPRDDAPVPNWSVQATVHEETYDRDDIVFTGAAGFRLHGYLFRPRDGLRTHPGVVVFHGHGPGAINTAIDGASYEKALAYRLASQGYVTLTYDARHFGRSMGSDPGVDHRLAIQRGLLEGKPLKGKMVADALRAVDLLASLDSVDANRIGVAGMSMGGEVSLMTAALDERVKAAVVAGFLTQYAGLTSDRPCCLCSYIPGITREMELVDIACAIAPRPVMYIHGEADKNFPATLARRLVDDIAPAYHVYGCPLNLGFNAHPGGHEMNAEAAIAWLDLHLKVPLDSPTGLASHER